MEYKKNRQKVILDSLGKFKNPDWNNLSLPALFSETEEAIEISRLKKLISDEQSKINSKIEGLLKNPHENDPVYKALNLLFKNKSDYNLHADHQETIKVKDAALNRFTLGYPPRKENDTSIGDAVNWEWIIHCASARKKNVIIVTRDSDYGANRKNESFINDWLYEEFKSRVGAKLELVLTQKLSSAFKLIHIPVSDAMEKEEDMMLEEYKDIDLASEDDNVTKKIFSILQTEK
jgi:hypothetical protein